MTVFVDSASWSAQHRKLRSGPSGAFFTPGDYKEDPPLFFYDEYFGLRYNTSDGLFSKDLLHDLSVSRLPYVVDVRFLGWTRTRSTTKKNLGIISSKTRGRYSIADVGRNNSVGMVSVIDTYAEALLRGNVKKSVAPRITRTRDAKLASEIRVLSNENYLGLGASASNMYVIPLFEFGFACRDTVQYKSYFSGEPRSICGLPHLPFIGIRDRGSVFDVAFFYYHPWGIQGSVDLGTATTLNRAVKKASDLIMEARLGASKCNELNNILETKFVVVERVLATKYQIAKALDIEYEKVLERIEDEVLKKAVAEVIKKPSEKYKEYIK